MQNYFPFFRCLSARLLATSLYCCNNLCTSRASSSVLPSSASETYHRFSIAREILDGDLFSSASGSILSYTKRSPWRLFGASGDHCFVLRLYCSLLSCLLLSDQYSIPVSAAKNSSISAVHLSAAVILPLMSSVRKYVTADAIAGTSVASPIQSAFSSSSHLLFLRNSQSSISANSMLTTVRMKFVRAHPLSSSGSFFPPFPPGLGSGFSSLPSGSGSGSVTSSLGSDVYHGHVQ